jgi:hypothetical protein
MMPRVQWQRDRVELAELFDRPLDGAQRLAALEGRQRELARGLQAGYERGERVLFDGHELTGEPAGERRVEDSPVARLVSGMLPPVQYASLLIDVHRDTGFLDELRHYGQGARSQARQGQLVAALLADIFGVGYARMALACAYSEREMREAAGRHFTAENLDAASAVVVQKLRLLPHEWIAELLMTSSDGTRLETIGKSPIAAYAARHAGYRRRVLTWLLWLGNVTGFV